MRKLSLAATTVAISILVCSFSAIADPVDSLLPKENLIPATSVSDEQECRRFYENVIKPRYLQMTEQRFPTQGTPTLRLFLGQPGSGTSGLMRRVNYQNPLSEAPRIVDLSELQRYSHCKRQAATKPTRTVSPMTVQPPPPRLSGQPTGTWRAHLPYWTNATRQPLVESALRAQPTAARPFGQAALGMLRSVLSRASRL